MKQLIELFLQVMDYHLDLVDHLQKVKAVMQRNQGQKLKKCVLGKISVIFLHRIKILEIRVLVQERDCISNITVNVVC